MEEENGGDNGEWISITERGNQTDGVGGFLQITYVGQTQEDVNNFQTNPVYNY